MRIQFQNKASVIPAISQLKSLGYSAGVNPQGIWFDCFPGDAQAIAIAVQYHGQITTTKTISSELRFGTSFYFCRLSLSGGNTRNSNYGDSIDPFRWLQNLGQLELS